MTRVPKSARIHEAEIARVRNDGARLRRPGQVPRPHVLADERRERRYAAWLRLVVEAVLEQEERAGHARQMRAGRRWPRMRSVGVERVVQPERLEDHRRQRLLVVHARGRLDDEASEDVVGVGIEPSRGRREMLAIGGIDKADQILGAELMVDVGDLNLADRDRLRIVGDRARHLEQRPDRHVLPRRILRQPFSDRVVELELARRFELEDQRGGEFLGVAADLEQRIGADRLRVGEPIVAGEDGDDRVPGAAVHLQCGA